MDLVRGGGGDASLDWKSGALMASRHLVIAASTHHFCPCLKLLGNLVGGYTR